MKMPQMTHILPTALLALTLAVPGAPAMAAITSQADNLAAPRGWSAIAGMDPSAVAELARTPPLSDQAAGDQPWCDRQAEVERTLSHDFGEEKVATGARGMVLWGSELMGTWTMVLERADATSCVVASGIGYSDTTSPQVFFSKAGLNG